MAKSRRRPCENPKCGKTFRYTKPNAKYCGRTCQNQVYRAGKAERDKAEKEGKLADLADMAAELERLRQVEAQIQAQPESPVTEPEQPEQEPAPPPAPAPPKHPPYGRAFRPPADQPVRITIHNVPTRFPGTPLRGIW